MTPGASSSFGIGFVRMTTKSGGVCYVAEEVAETKGTITLAEEEGNTSSKEGAETREKEVETQEGKKMEAVEASKVSRVLCSHPVPLCPAPSSPDVKLTIIAHLFLHLHTALSAPQPPAHASTDAPLGPRTRPQFYLLPTLDPSLPPPSAYTF